MQRLSWRWRTPAIALALVLFAVSAFIGSVTGAARQNELAASNAALREQVSSLRGSIDCRADIANRVNVIQGQRTAALADGLAAFADNNDAELARQTQTIHALAPQMAQALDDQAHQDRICEHK
jgi:hypothetical protein